METTLSDKIIYIALAVILCSGIIMLILWALPVVSDFMSPVPSESQCQGFNQNTDISHQFIEVNPYTYPEDMFCDYNSTGWHFNATKYNEHLYNVTQVNATLI